MARQPARETPHPTPPPPQRPARALMQVGTPAWPFHSATTSPSATLHARMVRSAHPDSTYWPSGVRHASTAAPPSGIMLLTCAVVDRLGGWAGAGVAVWEPWPGVVHPRHPCSAAAPVAVGWQGARSSLHLPPCPHLALQLAAKRVQHIHAALHHAEESLPVQREAEQGEQRRAVPLVRHLARDFQWDCARVEGSGTGIAWSEHGSFRHLDAVPPRLLPHGVCSEPEPQVPRQRPLLPVSAPPSLPPPKGKPWHRVSDAAP